MPIKIKKLLQGTWVDSIGFEMTLTFKDSLLFLTGNDTNNQIVTIKYRYQVDTNCHGLMRRSFPISYYLYAARLDHLDTVRRSESPEEPPRNEIYAGIEYINKRILFLDMISIHIEFILIKKE